MTGMSPKDTASLVNWAVRVLDRELWRPGPFPTSGRFQVWNGEGAGAGAALDARWVQRLKPTTVNPVLEFRVQNMEGKWVAIAPEQYTHWRPRPGGPASQQLPDREPRPDEMGPNTHPGFGLQIPPRWGPFVVALEGRFAAMESPHLGEVVYVRWRDTQRDVDRAMRVDGGWLYCTDGATPGTPATYWRAVENETQPLVWWRLKGGQP